MGKGKSEKRDRPDRNGEVSQYSLLGLIYRSVARKYSTYKNFDDKDLVRMRGLIADLTVFDVYNPDTVLPVIKKYDMELIISKEDPELVIIRPTNIREFPVTMAWRFGTVWKPMTHRPDNFVYPLIFESPHEGSDNITRVVEGLLLNVKARCCLFNGIHPDAGKMKGNGRKNSDVAHAPSSLFSEFQKEFTRMYPYLAVIQLHGMGGAPNFQCLLSDCFGSNWPSRAIGREVCKGLATYATKNQKNMICSCCAIKDEVDGRPVSDGPNKHFRSRTGCHNTTVQAHFLNGGSGMNKGTHDTGRFLHIETGAIWRGLIGVRHRGLRACISLYSKAIEYAMENWQKIPIPDNFDTGPEGDKEDIKDDDDGTEVEEEVDENGEPIEKLEPTIRSHCDCEA